MNCLKSVGGFQMGLVCLASALVCTASSQTATGKVVINELLYHPGGGGVESACNALEWVEIYNSGPNEVDVAGWTISNRDGEPNILLPPWTLPPECFLTIHQATGINDDDFSDLDGHYYTGDSSEVFDNDEDESALYSGFPGPSTIIDFIAWSKKSSYLAGTAHGYAVAAGIWASGDYYGSEGVNSGHTLARYFDGYDFDLRGDWRSISWVLYVHNAPLQPENPLQESPRNRSMIKDATPTFDWTDFPDADSYQLQVDNNWDFSSPEIDVSGLSESQYRSATSLPDDAYFYRVRAFVGDSPTPWAAEWLVVIDTGSLIGASPLVSLPCSCPHKYQRKDTKLLCI